MKVAFVCVQNAGRSQMATAFAKRERTKRGVESRLDIVTGGTRPAEHVHEEVVKVMREEGFDLSDRIPREVAFHELEDADYVVTMGCAASDVCPATFTGESRDWGLDDPDGGELNAVREIRNEIELRVTALFDELFGERRERAAAEWQR